MTTTKFSQKEITPTVRQKKRLHFMVVIFFILLSILAVASITLYAFEKKYTNRVYPQIYIGARNVSGLFEEELKKIIAQYRSDLEREGILFFYKDKQTPIFPQIIAANDPDLTYELFSIDIDATAEEALTVARTGNFWDNLKKKITLIKTPLSVPLHIQIFEDKVATVLKENFQDLEIKAKDAQLKIDAFFAVTIIPEEYGTVPDYKTAIAQLKINLQNFSKKEIVLVTKQDEPQIKSSQLQPKKGEIESLFTKWDTLTLSYKGRLLPISKDSYKDWIGIQGESLFLNEKLNDYIKITIAPEVEEPAQEARFQITSGDKVIEFKPSKEGVAIDYEKTQAAVNAALFDQTKENISIPLVTKTITPQYTTESVNNLGIKELIGKGTSNFSGSPENRRHNIKIGAETLNGLLIPPQEEFSLVKALGNVDKGSGYLPELVIKGNRTIPEFGGGLCQIGTTLFRAVLDSGLPVTERRSHSYRVRYYEPAGIDCTIYTPHPDCRFINDTEAYILIQTYITKKDDLIFEFWGTQDGRNVVMTKPVIYNITKPPPTKYIETEDLPQGETKCTERAHDGAETKFDYTVTYPDGTKKEQTFSSSYRPWQAVCLVGKEKNEDTPPIADEEKAVPEIQPTQPIQ